MRPASLIASKNARERVYVRITETYTVEDLGGARLDHFGGVGSINDVPATTSIPTGSGEMSFRYQDLQR
jgi:hypothetical protein